MNEKSKTIAEELYKDMDFYDYKPIINYLGKVLIQHDDDDYQGDSWVLYGKDNKYGYLCFGWGSCSGCDALQACSTYKEIDKLIKELENGIRWFDDAKEALLFFEEHDWDTDFNHNSSFINDTKEYLNKKIRRKK